MKRLFLWVWGSLAGAGLIVSSTNAQPYYLRGGFNGWDTSAPMTDNGSGVYSATVYGTPGSTFEYKVATADWSSSWPGSNGKSIFSSAGAFTAYFIPSPAADGWSPSANRVGYADPLQFGWELMGSPNGWTTPLVSLTSLGSGRYGGSYMIATPGTYAFKFREAGSWDISIGGDFGNSAGDISFTTVDSFFDVWVELDLPNGRWEFTQVPEPGVLSLLGAGAAVVLSRRRK
jgi:hypothetical protein